MSFLHEILKGYFGERTIKQTPIPNFITDNLKSSFALRPYQIESFQRFILFYTEDFTDKPKKPYHLMYNMATGSGKTLIMAGLMLYLYEKGFRNFIFFVNSNNIIKFPNEKANIENNDGLTDSDESDSESGEILPFDDNANDSSNDMLSFSENSSDIDYDLYLTEQCSQYLEKNFGIEYETADEKYKGYVKVDDRLYIFIDASNIDLVFPETDVFSWVIIDEIVNKKLSNNIPICNNIIALFSSNKLIKNIYNENNDIIDYPICVYICKMEEDSQYVNVESQPISNMSLISDKIQDPIFGNTLMFSTNILSNDEKNVERYCLFTTDAIYVLHNNFTKSEIGLINNKSCIRFLYKTKEMWAVKKSSLYSYI